MRKRQKLSVSSSEDYSVRMSGMIYFENILFVIISQINSIFFY